MKMKLHTTEYEVRPFFSFYKAGGHTAVMFITELGRPFCTLSVNLPDNPPPDSQHFWAKTYAENADLRDQMLATGMFEDTGKRAPTGFVEVELWKILSMEEVGHELV